MKTTPIDPSSTILTTGVARNSSRPGSKIAIFIFLNLAALMAIVFAMATHQHTNVGSALYVITLLFLCTLPMLTNYRGQYTLMLIFLLYFFAAFGAQDFVSIISGEKPYRIPVDAFLSGGEIAILLGISCFILGYVLAVKSHPATSKGVMIQEWSPNIMLIAGLSSWAIGFYITAGWQFGIADTQSGSGPSVSYGGIISLLRYLQPLGSLILIYLFLTTRSKSTLFIFIGTVCADVILGFLGDSKEIAIRAAVLYLFSAMLLRERLPVIQGILFIMIAGILFNIHVSYRDEISWNQESRSSAMSNIESRISSIARQGTGLGERLSDGAEYFTSRLSIKPFVEMIVERTGTQIEFQNGHTIKPLLYAFIPRLILPDKQDSSHVGRFFNREFRISEDPDTYIAFSQLGELYWNYGWGGLIAGMLMIGALMGTIASMLRPDTISTLPRFLLLMVTIYMLGLRFEGSIATVYSLWLRMVVLLLLIHFMMPKKRQDTTQ